MIFKETKLKTREHFSDFYFNIIIMSLLITIGAGIIGMIISLIPFIGSIGSIFISTAVGLIIAYYIKNIYYFRQKLSISNCLPSLSITFKATLINLINGVLIGILTPVLIVPIMLTGGILGLLGISFESFLPIVYITLILVILCTALIAIPIMIPTTFSTYLLIEDENTGFGVAFEYGWKILFKHFKFCLKGGAYIFLLTLLAIPTLGISLLITIPYSNCLLYEMFNEVKMTKDTPNFFE